MIRFRDFQRIGAPPLLSWVVRRRTPKAERAHRGLKSQSVSIRGQKS